MGTSTKFVHEHNLQKSFMSSHASSHRLNSKSLAIARRRKVARSVTNVRLNSSNNNNNNNNNDTHINTRSNAKLQQKQQLQPNDTKSTKESISNAKSNKPPAATSKASAIVNKSTERGSNRRNNNNNNNDNIKRTASASNSIHSKNGSGNDNSNDKPHPNGKSNKTNQNRHDNVNGERLNHENNTVSVAAAVAAVAALTVPIKKSTTSVTNTHHKSKVNQKSNEREANQMKGGRTKRKYLCHFCKKEFLGGNDLRKHIRIHTGERPFECTHCGQKFRQGGCLKNHVASQHGTSQTFTCFYCEKSFPIKERLRLHMRLHSGEKPYRCEICEKRFARGGQLTQHLATHNILKKHQCAKCPATFACLMSYKLHLKRHANERDITCHLCGKSFSRPDALRNHLSSIHENLKAFYCRICSRTFKGHLTQHMRTHENVKSFGCSMCGSFFSQKSQLQVHYRIHSGERPYRCQVCWHAFAHSSVLKLHIRKHTGEKPFKCMMCKDVHTAFSQLPHLKTHMRAIHGMDKTYNCEICSVFLKTKHELQEHRITCAKTKGQNIAAVEPDNVRSDLNNELMSLSKMRLLIAVLLKKISTQARLKQLGFDKRLIDNVLIGALEIADQPICDDATLSEIDRLRKNVQQFLEWSLPDMYIKKFKKDQRSAEELLIELTSNFQPETKSSNDNAST